MTTKRDPKAPAEKPTEMPTETEGTSSAKPPNPDPWHADKVRALRDFLHLTQTAFAQELGTQQQTVSEWECGYHTPKGMSVKMLNIIAERSSFTYQSVQEPSEEPQESQPPTQE